MKHTASAVPFESALFLGLALLAMVLFVNGFFTGIVICAICLIQAGVSYSNAVEEKDTEAEKEK